MRRAGAVVACAMIAATALPAQAPPVRLHRLIDVSEHVGELDRAEKPKIGFDARGGLVVAYLVHGGPDYLGLERIRVAPDGIMSAPTRLAFANGTRFADLFDLAVAPDGTAYCAIRVEEDQGEIVRFAPDGTRTAHIALGPVFEDVHLAEHDGFLH